jgi:hypothetical protein
MTVESLVLQLSVLCVSPELHHRSLRLPAGVRELQFGSCKALCRRLRWWTVPLQICLHETTGVCVAIAWKRRAQLGLRLSLACSPVSLHSARPRQLPSQRSAAAATARVIGQHLSHFSKGLTAGMFGSEHSSRIRTWRASIVARVLALCFE